MTAQSMTSALLVVGSFDVSPFTGDIVTTPGEVATKSYHVFGGGGFEYNAAAIKSGRFDLSGVGDYTVTTGISSVLNASALGVQKSLLISSPGTAAGDTAVIGRGIIDKVPQQMQVGEIPTWSLGAATDAPFVLDGRLACTLASRTTSGLTGTAVALTGPSATQSLYATLNVTAASGTDLVVKVQSDDNSSFTTATDRITFSTVSATGWQWSSVAGDLSTETYWRVVATIASGTFTFCVGFGVA